jgi:hypothetical protein
LGQVVHRPALMNHRYVISTNTTGGTIHSPWARRFDGVSVLGAGDSGSAARIVTSCGIITPALYGVYLRPARGANP